MNKTTTAPAPDQIEGHYIAPNGKLIVGTLETCPGCALITSISRAVDGSITLDYVGETKMYWDDQRTIERDGQTIFLDSDGHEWPESQLTFKRGEPTQEE